MKLFFVSAFIIFCANVFAQDTILYTTGAASFDTIRPAFGRTVSFDTIHQNYLLTTTSSDTVQPIKAQFPGGDSALNKFYAETLKYPPYALEHKVEGTVYVSFNVEEDGTLTHVKIVETPHKILCDEALRIVKLMPKWEPATWYGKPIKWGCNCRFLLR